MKDHQESKDIKKKHTLLLDSLYLIIQYVL